MKRMKLALPLAAALVFGGCSDGSDGSAGGPAAPDDDGAWMDGATVMVTRDEAARRETVTLVDPASGYSQVFDDEPLVANVIEVDDPEPMVAHALRLNP